MALLPTPEGEDSAPKQPSNPNETPNPDPTGFLEKTRVFWGSRYGREISLREAEEITHNMTSFFELLQTWDREATREEKQNGDDPPKRKESDG